MKRQKIEKDPGVLIRRAKVDSLCIYEITEDELLLLEQGSPGSLYLNISIALLSIASSFFISILTTKIDSNRTYTIFIVVTVVCLVAGIVLFIIWLFTFLSTKPISKKIRERLRGEIEPQT